MICSLRSRLWMLKRSRLEFKNISGLSFGAARFVLCEIYKDAEDFTGGFSPFLHGFQGLLGFDDC